MADRRTASVRRALGHVAHRLKCRLGLFKDEQRLIETGLPLSFFDELRETIPAYPRTSPPGRFHASSLL